MFENINAQVLLVTGGFYPSFGKLSSTEVNLSADKFCIGGLFYLFNGFSFFWFGSVQFLCPKL